MSTALLLVDIQRDYLTSSLLEPAAPELVARIGALLKTWREANRPVVHLYTRIRPDGADALPHWRRAHEAGLPLRCVRGTPGADPPAALAPRPEELVTEKTYHRGLDDPALIHALREQGVDRLVLVGLHLHACVRDTALSAQEKGFLVGVVGDAVGSDDPLQAAVARRWLERRDVVFTSSAEWLSLDSQATGSHRGRPTTATVRSQCSAARGASSEWAALSIDSRRSRVLTAADLLHDQSETASRTITLEIGKPLTAARGEVARAEALFRAAARLQPAETLAHGDGVHSRRVPVGVVALITPWNNPIGIPAGKLAPALVLGNCAIWKPSPLAPRCSALFASLLETAGFPPGVFSMAAATEDATRSLLEDPDLDAVSLSGSPAAGWAVQEVCARRRLPLQAELGGNNGAIVWGDTDLRHAAREIARGAFSFAGQRCTANRRVVVDTEVLAEFLDALIAQVGLLRWGDPMDPGTDVGPLVSAAAASRVEALIARSLPACRLLETPLGPPRASGAMLPPTILVADNPQQEIVQEETFGPVLVVQPARSFDEALSQLNGVRQGLIAALFSPDPERRRRFLARARAGILKLDQSTADAAIEAPFGGIGYSAIGPPEHGPGNLEFYTRAQAVYGTTG
jgi:acyl-CoA reductase-like NAD-dependent aldehyde dehydrogenase